MRGGSEPTADAEADKRTKADGTLDDVVRQVGIGCEGGCLGRWQAGDFGGGQAHTYGLYDNYE